jgi:MscS family membrane protein
MISTMQINLTSEVLSVTGYTLAIIRYFLVSAAVFLSGPAIAESIISSPKIDPEGIQASYLRALFGLLGFIAAAAIFITGLYRIGVSLFPLLTGLGVGGLAFALAARPTLENIIGSFMIFVDKPYRVGQRVNVLGQNGTVEAIGLRSTKIRLLTGHLTSIPNEKMAYTDHSTEAPPALAAMIEDRERLPSQLGPSIGRTFRTLSLKSPLTNSTPIP